MTQPSTASVRDTPHPYYGAEAFGDSAVTEFETLDELIEWARVYDEDLNFVYRWDWSVPDPRDYEAEPEKMPGETLTLFVVLQRKSRFLNISAPVTKDDEPKVREFLTSDRILGALRRTWAPLLDEELPSLMPGLRVQHAGGELTLRTMDEATGGGIYAVFDHAPATAAEGPCR